MSRSICRDERLTPVREGRAVFSRRRADSPEKCAAQYLCASETANVSHFVERGRSRFELPARRFDPQALDMPGWSLADLLPEYAGKISWTHGHPARQRIYRGFASEVIRDPG